jgi:hypothetical protein
LTVILSGAGWRPKLSPQSVSSLFHRRRTFHCPLIARDEIRGVIGISHGPGRSDDRHPTEDGMRRVLNHMNAHYAETLRLQELVKLAVLSIAQLERHFRRVF